MNTPRDRARVIRAARRPILMFVGAAVLAAACLPVSAAVTRNPGSALADVEIVEVRLRPGSGTSAPVAKRVRASDERDGLLETRGTVAELDPGGRRFLMHGTWFSVPDTVAMVGPSQRVDVDAEPLNGTLRVRKWEPYDSDNPWDQAEGPLGRLEYAGDQLIAFHVADLRIAVNGETDFELSGATVIPLIGSVDQDDRRYGPGQRVGPFLLSGKAQISQEHLGNHDLAESGDPDSLRATLGGEIELRGKHFAAVRTFAKVRIEQQFEGHPAIGLWDSRVETQWRELFVLIGEPARSGVLRVGRQRLDEPREWLFDDSVDGVMYYVERAPFALQLVGAGHLVDAETNDEGVRYGMIYLGAIPSRRLHAAAYFLARADDVRRREPNQTGVRALGRSSRWAYWIDGAMQRGSWQGRELRAHAADVGFALAAPLPTRPWLTIGYALGSGDPDPADAVDREFRQPDLADNNDRFLGVSSYRYYGVLLQPELSNMRILTVGAGFRPGPRVSMDVVFHRYRQDVPRRDLDSELDLEPVHRTGEIGDELDLVAAARGVWLRWDFSLLYGRFVAGSGFNEPGQVATRVRLATQVNF